MTNSNVQLGDHIRFKPTCWCSGKGGTFDANILQNGVEVDGVVDYIHEEHHWYRIRYEVAGVVMHECFPISMPAARKEYKRENLHNKGRTSGEGLHYREKEKN